MILIRDLMRSIFGTYLPLVDYNGDPLQGLAAVHTSLISERLLACINNIRPILSLTFFVAFNT